MAPWLCRRTGHSLVLRSSEAAAAAAMQLVATPAAAAVFPARSPCLLPHHSRRKLAAEGWPPAPRPQQSAGRVVAQAVAAAKRADQAAPRALSTRRLRAPLLLRELAAGAAASAVAALRV